MKKIAIILIFGFSQIIFSQEICEISKEISKRYYVLKDTIGTIKQLEKLRSNKDREINNLVDFALAEIYFDMNEIDSAKVLFEKTLNEEKLYAKKLNECESIFLEDLDYVNILSYYRDWEIRVKCLEYLSKIEFEAKNYNEALNKLDLSLVEKRKHIKKYGCGNHAYRDIIVFEKNRFKILKKMGSDSLANSYASKVMFIPSVNSDFLNDVVNSLRKEFPNVNIKKEILHSVSKLQNDSIIINGLKMKMNLLRLFDKEIAITHPYSGDKNEIQNYISRRLDKIK